VKKLPQKPSLRRGSLEKIQALLYVLPGRGKNRIGSVPGGVMPIGYYVLGAIALVVIIVALSMLPDFVRYMKIRSM